MRKLPIGLLGVSFDNGTLDEITQQIFQLILKNRENTPCEYISTVNVDFLCKAHTINWRQINDPELMAIYRQSRVVTCDGIPLIWLSKLLGSPLQERATGVALIPRLAALLADHNKSIFLLGGTAPTNKVTAITLEAISPGLRIAGRSSPSICTEGSELRNMDEQDDLLIEEINKAAPDLLLIAFGNPKQEKWFERVRHRLRVPVAIGVGGSFDIISGALARAPEWIQQVGLEWLFRLIQEPKRLAKRYFIDAWKFFGITIPLLIYHPINRFLSWIRLVGKQNSFSDPLLFLSSTQTIALIPLPSLIDADYCHFVEASWQDIFNQDNIILDFENVKHLSLEGLSLLIKTLQQAIDTGKELYIMNVSGDIKLFLKIHRVWDLMKDREMKTPSQMLQVIIQEKGHPRYFDSIQQTEDHAIVYFLGSIGQEQNTRRYLEKLAPLLRGKDCILDFRYCTYIDSSGFSFLLKLKKLVEHQKQLLYLRRRNALIKHLFKLNRVEEILKR